MGVFDHFPYTNFHELNLSWCLKLLREFDTKLDELEEWRNTHEQEYKELKEFMDAINSGNFPDSMLQAMRDWLTLNAPSIIGDLIKTVFFYLDDNGYFVAVIPDSWSELVFGTTGLDTFPVGYDYGHLTIDY